MDGEDAEGVGEEEGFFGGELQVFAVEDRAGEGVDVGVGVVGCLGGEEG